MKTTPLLLAAAVLAAALPADGAMALAYHGKLVPVGDSRINPNVPMTVEFRIYKNADPGETAPLWGRLAPVRFDLDNGGPGCTFYTELADGTGAPSQNARYERLADALAEAGTNAWLSVKPAGCGELLPRKRISGLHRAEVAATANSAAALETKSLKAATLNVANCTIASNLTVTGTFSSSGGRLVNTFDGTTGATIGAAGGSVVVSPAFDNWYDLTYVFRNPSHFACDMLIMLKNDSEYGALSVPVQGSAPGSGFGVEDRAYLVQMFLNGFYNPFF